MHKTSIQTRLEEIQLQTDERYYFIPFQLFLLSTLPTSPPADRGDGGLSFAPTRLSSDQGGDCVGRLPRRVDGRPPPRLPPSAPSRRFGGDLLRPREGLRSLRRRRRTRKSVNESAVESDRRECGRERQPRATLGGRIPFIH